MRIVLALTAAATLATTPAVAATTRGTLYGLVTAGPITPVCRADRPCDAPVQVTLVFSRAGKDVATARATAAGRYRITLAAGYYTVRTVERIGLEPSIRPRNVHVRAGHADRLDFSIDTGIR